MLSQAILPQDPTEAVKKIIKLVKALIALMDREAIALAKSDGVALAGVEEEKVGAVEAYQKAAEEFKSRLKDFRGINGAYIEELEKLQADLVDRTQNNLDTMQRMGVTG